MFGAWSGQTGTSMYEKVPTPGKPDSDEPAIDGPASRIAQARMKLNVRI
jgi:hypothetical protein